LAANQCASFGNGLVTTQGDGQAQGRVPSMGRVCRAAADRVWLHHNPTELATHCAHYR
jgi:hypothetical protein